MIKQVAVFVDYCLNLSYRMNSLGKGEAVSSILTGSTSKNASNFSQKLLFCGALVALSFAVISA